MHCTREIVKNIHYIGASDRRINKFENLFPIQNGMAYNSYLINDIKTAVIDTVDHAVSRQFIDNLQYVLGEKTLDYVVINHMEPDHCASLQDVILRYPNVKIVGNAKTIQFFNQFFGNEFSNNFVIISETDELVLGEHTLKFIFAPMVHWPEAMFSYEVKTKTLFSADAFGSFGANNGNLFDNEIDIEKTWVDEARRYYANIVGKYGTQVLAALNKTKCYDINQICPLHGVIWQKNIDYVINKYLTWASYIPECKGVLVAYASMYGNTENVAELLATTLAENGINNISMLDVSGADISYLVADAFKYSHIVILGATYNGGIYPKMEYFLNDMKALNLQNRKFAVITNGTWAPTSGIQMCKILQELKNCEVYEQIISVKSSAKDEINNQILNLTDYIKNSMA